VGNKKARLVITYHCHRECKDCCNHHHSTMKDVKATKVADLAWYEKVIITGGEPLLYPKKLFWLVHQLRMQSVEQKVYLNTSLASPWLIENLDLFDGITLGLHAPANDNDISRFFNFQTAIRGRKESYRLYVDTGIKERVIPIIPDRWTRVEMGPMLLEGECPVPIGEDLLELQDGEFHANYEEWRHEI